MNNSPLKLRNSSAAKLYHLDNQYITFLTCLGHNFDYQSNINVCVYLFVKKVKTTQ